MAELNRERKAARKVIVSGGVLGGVGKSFVAMAVLDYVVSKGERVLLVESDWSTPDVWKAYKDEVKCEPIDLDENNGWLQLLNVCEANADRHVIINSTAKGVSTYCKMLSKSLGELQRELITLWVINRQRRSLEFLKAYRDAVPDSTTHVVRNGYFGVADTFELYNNSNVRKSVENAGGKTVTFPELAGRVSDDLYSKRMSINRASIEMPIGHRAELSRWRGVVHKMMDEVGCCS